MPAQLARAHGLARVHLHGEIAEQPPARRELERAAREGRAASELFVVGDDARERGRERRRELSAHALDESAERARRGRLEHVPEVARVHAPDGARRPGEPVEVPLVVPVPRQVRVVGARVEAALERELVRFVREHRDRGAQVLEQVVAERRRAPRDGHPRHALDPILAVPADHLARHHGAIAQAVAELPRSRHEAPRAAHREVHRAITLAAREAAQRRGGLHQYRER